MILSFGFFHNPGQMNTFDSNTSKQHPLTKLFFCSDTYENQNSPPAAWKPDKTVGSRNRMGQPVPWQIVNDPSINLNSGSPGAMKLQWFKFFKESVLGSAFYCSFYNSVYNLYDIIKWKLKRQEITVTSMVVFKVRLSEKEMCKYSFFPT